MPNKLHKYSISYLKKGQTQVEHIDYEGYLTKREVIKRYNLNDKGIVWLCIIPLDGFWV